MEELIMRIKKVYPLMKVVPYEANDENSIKFNRYGFIDFNDWAAIRCSKNIELYDEEGILREIIDEKGKLQIVRF